MIYTKVEKPARLTDIICVAVQGYCMQGDLCPFDHGTDPVVVDDVNLSTVLPGSQGKCALSLAHCIILY